MKRASGCPFRWRRHRPKTPNWEPATPRYRPFSQLLCHCQSHGIPRVKTTEMLSETCTTLMLSSPLAFYRANILSGLLASRRRGVHPDTNRTLEHPRQGPSSHLVHHYLGHRRPRGPMPVMPMAVSPTTSNCRALLLSMTTCEGRRPGTRSWAR